MWDVMLCLNKMTKKLKNNFDQWWNDGEHKTKKFLYLFLGWWDDGNSKLLKAVYISLAVHLIFAIFWFLFIGFSYMI